MRTLISNAKAITCLAGLALCAALFSFSTNRGGGEGFEIYLNNKLVLQQFNHDMKAIKTLKLDQTNENDELSVRYYHCGHVGKNRVISIKGENDIVLKQWKFTDVTNSSASMSCKVKDILQ